MGSTTEFAAQHAEHETWIKWDLIRSRLEHMNSKRGTATHERAVKRQAPKATIRKDDRTRRDKRRRRKQKTEIKARRKKSTETKRKGDRKTKDKTKESKQT